MTDMLDWNDPEIIDGTWTDEHGLPDIAYDDEADAMYDSMAESE